MANKKLLTLAAIALLGTFGLTACDNTVTAKPTGYDDALVEIKTEAGKDIYHNISSIIADAYHDGSMPADVLDEILYQYACSLLGNYNKITAKNINAADGITLKEAYKAAKTGDAATLGKFVKEHKAYWLTNADGDRLNDDGKTVRTDVDTATEREKARVMAKWENIENRIAEAMYDKMTAGAYSQDNKFSEKKLLSALYYDMRKVGPVAGATTVEDVLIDPEVEKKDVWSHFLTRSNYQANAAYDAVEDANSSIKYIEDDIIPTIYRSLLTEQYILDQVYNTLGHSSARKVNVFSIVANDKYNKAAPYLMNDLVEQINNKSVTVNADTFKEYAKVWRGVDIDCTTINTSTPVTIQDRLVKSGAFSIATANDGTKYLTGTKYGDLREDFDKIKDDPLLTDEAIESDFTSSGSRTKEKGLELKTDDIRLQSFVTTGWYKSSVENLPSSITKRLFHRSVALAVDAGSYDKETDKWILRDTDRFNTDGTYDAKKDYNDYVAKINGKYYLKNNSTEQGDDQNDILFFDRDSKTYYVVQIEEAVNTTKFTKTSNGNYDKIKDENVMETYVNDVLKIVASGDTYESLSKKHWLKEMDIKYHDTAIYDYFKTNYPELFE